MDEMELIPIRYESEKELQLVYKKICIHLIISIVSLFLLFRKYGFRRPPRFVLYFPSRLYIDISIVIRSTYTFFFFFCSRLKKLSSNILDLIVCIVWCFSYFYYIVFFLVLMWFSLCTFVDCQIHIYSILFSFFLTIYVYHNSYTTSPTPSRYGFTIKWYSFIFFFQKG